MTMTKLLLFLLTVTPVFGQTSSIKVTLLGTSGPSLSNDRAEAGTLVQAGAENLLFDCGRGVPERLVQLGLGNINKVFLTHLHSDHTQGLPILWMGGWNGRGTNALSLWGPGMDVDQPTGTTGLAAQLMTAYATNTHIRRDLVEHWQPEAITIAAHDISEGVVYQNNGVTVTAFLVDHAPVKPAFGYRVDYAGHSIAISGDTRPSDNLVKFAKGVDLLVHEVWTGAASADIPTSTYHTTPEQAADIFKRAAPRLALYSHFAPMSGDMTARTRAGGYSGPLQTGSDLTSVDVGEKITVNACSSASTPVAAAVTNEEYKDTISAKSILIVWGSGFSPEGGNSLRFTRTVATGPGPGGPVQAAIVLDESTGLLFWDKSSTQINGALDGKLSAGLWMMTVRNGCGVTSAALPITLR